MNRKEYLDAAMQIICKDRQDVHGQPEQCFSLIGEYWTDFISHKVGEPVQLSPADVAVMMTLFKVARWQMNGQHCDNVIDGIGYFALAGELTDRTEYKAE